MVKATDHLDRKLSEIIALRCLAADLEFAFAVCDLADDVKTGFRLDKGRATLSRERNEIYMLCHTTYISHFLPGFPFPAHCLPLYPSSLLLYKRLLHNSIAAGNFYSASDLDDLW